MQASVAHFAAEDERQHAVYAADAQLGDIVAHLGDLHGWHGAGVWQIDPIAAIAAHAHLHEGCCSSPRHIHVAIPEARGGKV